MSGSSQNKNSEKVLSQKPLSMKATPQVTPQQALGEGTETILQFNTHGKWYNYSSLNLDHVEALNEEGITEQERMKRAMDLNNRQFIDRFFNQVTKKHFKENHNREPLPDVSLKDQPSAIFRPTLGTVKEWREMTDIILQRHMGGLKDKSALDVNRILHRALLEEIKNPTTQPGRVVNMTLRAQTGTDPEFLFRPERLATRIWTESHPHVKGAGERARGAINAIVLAAAKALNTITEVTTRDKAEEQATKSFEKKFLEIADYLDEHPDQGLLVVSIFHHIQQNEFAAEVTRFTSQFLVPGGTSFEEATKRYFRSDRLHESPVGLLSYIEERLLWIPPPNTMGNVPIEPPK
jgi:hypothetical protein